jgi:hypothetical protein
MSPAEEWRTYTELDKSLFYHAFSYGYITGMVYILNQNSLGKEDIEKYRLVATQHKRILKFMDSAYKKKQYQNMPYGPMIEIIFQGIFHDLDDDAIYKHLDRRAAKYNTNNIEEKDKLDIQKRRSQARDLMQ